VGFIYGKEEPLMNATAARNAKKKIIAKGQFMRFVMKGDWEYFERNNCSAIVIILAMTDDQKVIFVEQYRPPVNKNVIEFPAGLVNDHEPCKVKEGKKSTLVYKKRPKESIALAAKRELFEETGYKAKRVVKLLDGPVSGGACADIVTIVHAQDIKKVGDGGGDFLESIIIHEVPLNEVEPWLSKMKRKGCLIEPKIYTGLYFLNKYNEAS